MSDKFKTLSEDTLMAETGKGFEFLARRSEVDSSRVEAIGFCMGGRLAFLANAEHAHRLKATICFYGGGIAPQQDRFGRLPVIERVEEMHAPLLLIYGAEDTSIAPDEHGRIAETLSKAKKRYTLSIFPGAGHGFLSAKRDTIIVAAAEEAWQITLNFFAHHL